MTGWVGGPDGCGVGVPGTHGATTIGFPSHRGLIDRGPQARTSSPDPSSSRGRAPSRPTGTPSQRRPWCGLAPSGFSRTRSESR